jgi:hypothetical protein
VLARSTPFVAEVGAARDAQSPAQHDGGARLGRGGEHHLTAGGLPGAGHGVAAGLQRAVQPHLQVGGGEDQEGIGEGAARAVGDVVHMRRDVADGDVLLHACVFPFGGATDQSSSERSDDAKLWPARA